MKTEDAQAVVKAMGLCALANENTRQEDLAKEHGYGLMGVPGSIGEPPEGPYDPAGQIAIELLTAALDFVEPRPGETLAENEAMLVTLSKKWLALRAARRHRWFQRRRRTDPEDLQARPRRRAQAPGRPRRS